MPTCNPDHYHWRREPQTVDPLKAHLEHVEVVLVVFDVEDLGHIVVSVVLASSLLFDHLVGAGDVQNCSGGWCHAPNTSLVPVYDRITLFGNSALRIGRG